jgi:hypothetical protein
MSIDQPAGLNEDSRLILAEQAAGAARRNTPRYLLVGATGLLVVASALLLAAISLRAAAGAGLQSEREQFADTQRAVAALLAAREQEQAVRASKLLEPDILLANNLSESAKNLGLDGLGVNEGNDGRSGAPAGFGRKNYSVSLSKPVPADELIRWIDKALRETPGLELHRLELTPAKASFEGVPRWTGSLAFTRWERRQ